MSGRRAADGVAACEPRDAPRAARGTRLASRGHMRIAASFAILLAAGMPAFAEPTALQLDALAGDAHMTGPRADSWADGARLRLGIGARHGAWAAMVRVGMMTLEPSATNVEDSHLRSWTGEVNVEWYPLRGRWEPFVSLGAHDDRTTG